MDYQLNRMQEDKSEARNPKCETTSKYEIKVTEIRTEKTDYGEATPSPRCLTLPRKDSSMTLGEAASRMTTEHELPGLHDERRR
jgi:hypothetical protein